jgi:hypothetical protein
MKSKTLFILFSLSLCFLSTWLWDTEYAFSHTVIDWERKYPRGTVDSRNRGCLQTNLITGKLVGRYNFWEGRCASRPIECQPYSCTPRDGLTDRERHIQRHAEEDAEEERLKQNRKCGIGGFLCDDQGNPLPKGGTADPKFLQQNLSVEPHSQQPLSEIIPKPNSQRGKKEFRRPIPIPPAFKQK